VKVELKGKYGYLVDKQDKGMVKGIVKYKKSGFLERSSAGSDELSTSTRAIAQESECCTSLQK
jgi:hypothetical protein